MTIATRTGGGSDSGGGGGCRNADTGAGDGSGDGNADGKADGDGNADTAAAENAPNAQAGTGDDIDLAKARQIVYEYAIKRTI